MVNLMCRQAHKRLTRAPRLWRGLIMAAMMWTSCSGGVGLDGPLVGGSCRDDRDCDVESRCLKGKRFPEGTCALPCRDSRDCPATTACVDREGGVCLLMCELRQDCRLGYDCDRERLREGGQEQVCVADD